MTEVLRQERKERKKARRASEVGVGRAEGEPRAVVPAEPSPPIHDGVRSCSKSSDFATLCLLGKGAFGRVTLVRWRGDGRGYAMKVVRVADCEGSMASQLLAERRVLTELAERPHALLASACCCFRSAHHLHFVMPYLPGGTIAQLLRRMPYECLPEDSARFYTAQLALALGALHERKILYLDLKLENVLLSPKGDATLVDFGFVRCDVDVAAGATVKRAGGTRAYSAPEAILSQPVGAPCDWWALGVILFELLTGSSPFTGDKKAMGQAICNARVRFPTREADATDAPEPPSGDAISMVRRLLTKQVEARLGSKDGIAEFKAQPFLRPIDWSALADGSLPRPHVPSLASDTDVRYFDRNCTAKAAGLSMLDVGEDGAAEVAAGAADAAAKAAKLAELAEETARLASRAAEEAKAADEARKTAAVKAIDDARQARVQAATDAAAEALKKARGCHKKLRQIDELAEQQAAGKALNSEQRKKLATAAKLREELEELNAASSALDESARRVTIEVSEERRWDKERALKERAAKEGGEAKADVEGARAAEGSVVSEADDEEEAEVARVHIAELLTVEQFAYVAPYWR